jgi:RNA polymerase sigma-70 factor (ECF subfamily)
VRDLSNGTERGNAGPRFVAIIFSCAWPDFTALLPPIRILASVNSKASSGVLRIGTAMDAFAGSVAGTFVSRDAGLAREFEERLADCPALAFRVALGVLRNRAEAEDVAQDALVRAYRNFHRLRERERFRAWLVRTAWRLALDRIRARGRRERYEEAAAAFAMVVEAAAATAEDMAASREFECRVNAALDALPEKLRLVMILAAIEGHEAREVAVLLEIPEGTVKSRLFLARKQMAEKLQWTAGNIKKR